MEIKHASPETAAKLDKPSLKRIRRPHMQEANLCGHAKIGWFVHRGITNTL